MTVKTQGDLNTYINTNVNDNTTGDISAADIRTAMVDVVDTMFDVTLDDAGAVAAVQASGQFANAHHPIMPFSDAESYNTGWMALQNGHIWIATKNMPPGVWNPADWTQLTVDEARVAADIASQERFQGMAVTAAGAGEVAFSAIPNAAAANRGHYWMVGETVATPGVVGGPLDGMNVNAGDMVYSDGAAMHVVPTGASGTGGLSQAVADGRYAPGKAPIAAHDGRFAYKTGDQVMKNGQLYTANSDLAAHAWVPTEWDLVGGSGGATVTVNKPNPGDGAVGDIMFNDANVYIKVNLTTWKAIKLDSAFA